MHYVARYFETKTFIFEVRYSNNHNHYLYVAIVQWIGDETRMIRRK